MEINGMAHVMLTCSNFPRAREFYGKLLPCLGLTPVIDTADYYYCVGGRTRARDPPAAPEHAGEPFVQSRVGLHHLCFRARTRETVDELYAFLQRDRRDDRAPARGGRLRAGLLLGALRRPRRHPPRDELRPRQGPPREPPLKGSAWNSTRKARSRPARTFASSGETGSTPRMPPAASATARARPTSFSRRRSRSAGSSSPPSAPMNSRHAASRSGRGRVLGPDAQQPVARAPGLDADRLRAHQDRVALPLVHLAVGPGHLDDRDHGQRGEGLGADPEAGEAPQGRLLGDPRGLAQRSHRGELLLPQPDRVAVVRRVGREEGRLEGPAAFVQGITHRHLRVASAR